MKNEKRMRVAFLLNLFFSAVELLGGILTGSIAILSDAIHDLGDSASIGISLILERISNRPADKTYSHGYLRFSVLGSLITYGILIVGSLGVIAGAVGRLLHPVPIRYDGMILLAVFGTAVNLLAAWITHGGDSLNRRAVSLHLLEDVLGWLVVLVGAIVMKITHLSLLDPLLSIGVAFFILYHAGKGCLEVIRLFLEKTPAKLCLAEIQNRLEALEQVKQVHMLRVRSLDGFRHQATLHAVIHGEPSSAKAAIRATLAEYGVIDATVETELPGEACMTQFGSVHMRCGHRH